MSQVEIDYLAYHQSIGEELSTIKNRIRNLIGNNHWQTDGEHKESILRKILRQHISENYSIGKGFICYPDKSVSNQIDILIADKSYPTLFKDGEMIITTPDSVRAIIEVKSKQSSKIQLKETLEKLSSNIEKIRNYQEDCLAGLFIFDGTPNFKLDVIKESSRNNIKRAVNIISSGDTDFVRYWPSNSRTGNMAITQKPGWIHYKLENLAPAYFISNILLESSKLSMTPALQKIWFPIKGGKCNYEHGKAFVDSNHPWLG